MKLALGTAQFGMSYGINNTKGKVPLKEVEKILDCSRSNKIDVIDTAISYGDSEEKLGKLGVKDFKIISKIPEIPEGESNTRDWIFSQVERSLKRLNVDNLYGLMLHRPGQLEGKLGEDIRDALYEIQEQGLSKKIGISVYDIKQIEKAIQNFAFDIIQSPFNLVDQRLDDYGSLNNLKKNRIEVHTRSVFLQGLLLRDYNFLPDRFKQWDNLFRDWNHWISKHNISRVTACLQFVIQNPNIDRIVIGIETLNQLNEIVNSSNSIINFPFPDIRSHDSNLINPSNW